VDFAWLIHRGCCALMLVARKSLAQSASFVLLSLRASAYGPRGYPQKFMARSVVIVGAGPAGAAAAIELSRAGASVTVIDKAVFPRDKCCGDGLTAGALRHLDHLGLDPGDVATWKPVTDVWITRPSGESMLFPLPEGPGQFAATAARQDLDMALVNLAIEEGADIRQGVALESVSLFDDRVELHTSDGVIEADWLIAADGMWSPTRKALGLTHGSYRGEWHAFRQYFANVSPLAAKDLNVWFEPDILPGYMWCFPLPDNRANIGFGVLRGGDHKMKELGDLWRDLLERPHIRDVIGHDAVPEGTHKAWPIPARIGELPLTAHRTFFVGDATGACDPMTGEGIGQALQTGMAGAEAIIQAATPIEAALWYEREADQELGVDMRFAATLGTVLGSEFGAEWALKTAGMTNWTSRNFARWLFEDYPRALLGTPRRWSRDMFAQPGAYADN
jgi:geranylgeranyl reductase family protein